MKKVYISGPITGMHELNIKAFEEAEKYINSVKGHIAVNPFNLDNDGCESWESFMRRDIKALMDCDRLVYLEGSMSSRGAQLEIYIARSLFIPTITFIKFKEFH